MRSVIMNVEYETISGVIEHASYTFYLNEIL